MIARAGTAGLAAPYLAGAIALVAVPGLFAVGLAFFDYSGFGPPRWVGVENFVRLGGDDLFWTATGNSIVYAALAVPLRLAVATGAALVLHQRARGVSAARAAVFFPSIVPEAAYALLWLWLLNPVYGPLAAVAASLGVTSTGLLTDPWTTRAALAVSGAFQVGEAFVVALAARRLVPPSLYDAAAVDGAGPLFVLRRVTLPLMAPLLVLLALRDVVLSFQTSFVPALVITDGGPRYATTYLPLHVYRTAFSHFRFGYAAAMSVALLLTTAVLAVATALWARRRAWI